MKKQMKLEIEKLHQGYVITKEDLKTAVNNIEDLEKTVSEYFSAEIKLKKELHFKEKKNVTITITVEYN